MKPSKVDLSYDLQNLLPEFLQLTPELKEAYLQYASGWGSELSQQDKQRLEQIAKLHGILPTLDAPGMHVIFEELLIPYVVTLYKENNLKYLRKILFWIEDLINRKEFNVKNLVLVSFCDSLVANYYEETKGLSALMGERTKESYQQMVTEYKSID